MMDALLGRCFARCAGNTGAVVARSSSYCSPAANSSNMSSRIDSRRDKSSVQFLRPSLIYTTKLSSSVTGSSCSRLLGRSEHLRTPFLANSSAASAAQVDDDFVDNNDFGTADPSGTVRVRFLLQKECLFGQQFAVIGDQPCMGLWDPSDAVPLEWSDGHIWKAELDLPVDKEIQFKFILRGSSGEINWQPGPDRLLQTWEAQNTIVVSEDWEIADDQKITEESLDTPAEEAAEMIVESIDNINEPSLVILEAAQETRESVVDVEFPGKIHFKEKLEESMDEGDMILVPGLTPTSIAVTAQNIVDASFGAEEESNNHNFVQLLTEEDKTETPSTNLLEENIALPQASDYDSELTPDCDDVINKEETPPKQDDRQSTDNLAGKDMQWGRSTLEQLLMNLGFTTKSTETT